MPRHLPLLLLLLAACAREPAERIQFYEIDLHRAGTNLPRWAACWFPQRANRYAVMDAQPCPPETRATRAYTVDDVVGCWTITGEIPTAFDSAFFAAPVRLLRGRTPRLRAMGFGTPGDHGVEPLAPDADSLEPGLRTAWDVAPPDLLWISRTDGYGGLTYTFRVRGDSLIGMAQFFGDVIFYSIGTGLDAAPRIHGHRVPCPRRR
ncbi:hypothetical protein [Longimicrobium sp.]|uniref:hypothetical protein n=1 Tax=Longimicrobium sp. TaxID=2029185 RepID=UPI002CA3B5CD|nr:hypothetical protein [Longimicrobium sp.]HSU15230.1 hypothetical protein [Longimicrobium sp.]